MPKSKKTARTILILLACVLLLAVFTVTDLAISRALYGDMPQFARFFEIYGYLPSCMLACGMAAVGFCTQRGVARPIPRVMGFFLFPLVSVAGCAFGAIVVCRRVFEVSPNPWILLCGAALFTSLLFFLVSRFSSKRLAAYRRGALAALFALVLLLISVELLKNIFGRVRFREMSAPFEEFTRWYIINGPTSHKSFPSGHTANAAAVLCLTLTARQKRTRQILWGIGAVYILVMALSRIIAGAHFASDVLAGGLIGVGCVLLSRKLFKLPA